MKMKGILGLVLVLALALTIGSVAASAGASGDSAVAAKKKKSCKKKKKKSSASAAKKKKKKCKKPGSGNGGNGGNGGGGSSNPVTLVRATLNWSNGPNDADLDLFVFDTNSGRAGNGSDTISSSTLSPDQTGPSGSETFTDLAFQQKRAFSFGVCYLTGGSNHVDYTITYVTSDGVTHTQTRADDGVPPSLGSKAHVDYPGGAPIPTDYCPGTNLVP